MEPGNIHATLPHPTSAYHVAGSVSALSAFLSPTLPQGSYAQFSEAFCRICAVQMTTSLPFASCPKKHLWLLSPLTAVTLKASRRTWNSFSKCCCTRCT